MFKKMTRRSFLLPGAMLIALGTPGFSMWGKERLPIRAQKSDARFLNVTKRQEWICNPALLLATGPVSVDSEYRGIVRTSTTYAKDGKQVSALEIVAVFYDPRTCSTVISGIPGLADSPNASAARAQVDLQNIGDMLRIFPNDVYDVKNIQAVTSDKCRHLPKHLHEMAHAEARPT